MRPGDTECAPEAPDSGPAPGKCRLCVEVAMRTIYRLMDCKDLGAVAERYRRLR